MGERFVSHMLDNIASPAVWDYTIMGRGPSVADNARLRESVVTTYFESAITPDTSQVILLDDYPLGRDTFVFFGVLEREPHGSFPELPSIAQELRIEMCFRYGLAESFFGFGSRELRVILIDSDKEAQKLWANLGPLVMNASGLASVTFAAGRMSIADGRNTRIFDVASSGGVKKKAGTRGLSMSTPVTPNGKSDAIELLGRFFQETRLQAGLIHELTFAEVVEQLKRVPHPRVRGVVFFFGLILSPLTPWNDSFINVPLGVLIGYALLLLFRVPMTLGSVIGYWSTNVIGVIMIAVAAWPLRSAFRISGLRHQIVRATLTILVFSALMAALGFLLQTWLL
jgi:hypothetical protein